MHPHTPIFQASKISNERVSDGNKSGWTMNRGMILIFLEYWMVLVYTK